MVGSLGFEDVALLVSPVVIAAGIARVWLFGVSVLGMGWSR